MADGEFIMSFYNDKRDCKKCRRIIAYEKWNSHVEECSANKNLHLVAAIFSIIFFSSFLTFLFMPTAQFAVGCFIITLFLFIGAMASIIVWIMT